MTSNEFGTRTPGVPRPEFCSSGAFCLFLQFMEIKSPNILLTLTVITLILSGIFPVEISAQNQRKKSSVVRAMEKEQKKKNDEAKIRALTAGFQQEEGEVMKYIIEDGDTIYIDEIKAARVWERLPRQKGRNWRKYYRLVHNFSKTYPYALVARKLVMEADSTIEADNLKRLKKDKYVDQVQKELFEVFEGQMRNLTVSQGALLMKLIDREVGKSSFNIIKDYKNSMAAGFWQGVAKMFGTDLKKPYDPEGEDLLTEELVQIWEDGEFEPFYWSIFWKEPPKVEIPDKYL